MGQTWDGGNVAFRPETWAAIGEHLLPGAYLLAFGGTRTWHRLAVAIEDAGFEIRDTIAWIYGSGFPKSHDVSKAIDKSLGIEREDKFEGAIERFAGPTGNKRCGKCGKWLISSNPCRCPRPQDEPKTELAKTWDGYGTALKPAFEPIIMARKPVENTVAKNCVDYGSGAVNIDGCRIEGEPVPINKLEEWSGFGQKVRPDYVQEMNTLGRWPANLIHDGSEEVLKIFPGNAGAAAPVKRGHSGKSNGIYNDYAQKGDDGKTFRGDSGSAARFFYCAKASKSERDAGCIGEKEQSHNRFDKCAKCGGYILQNPDRPSACKCENPKRVHAKAKNNHPTVKPLALTEYLARLILPPDEYAPRRILVPFSGSGSEMIGAYMAGWEDITGVELAEEYVKISQARLKYWTNIPAQKALFRLEEE